MANYKNTILRAAMSGLLALTIGCNMQIDSRAHHQRHSRRVHHSTTNEQANICRNYLMAREKGQDIDTLIIWNNILNSSYGPGYGTVSSRNMDNFESSQENYLRAPESFESLEEASSLESEYSNISEPMGEYDSGVSQSDPGVADVEVESTSVDVGDAGSYDSTSMDSGSSADSGSVE